MPMPSLVQVMILILPQKKNNYFNKFLTGHLISDRMLRRVLWELV